ncbi:MAG: hydrogenase maturation protease [Planctomycetes bacterium]|jgi:hydrogenase maturation protease|nr:hydrogenase maturation protease [Planctomycetota bacterium]
MAEPPDPGKRLILGVGNWYRSDDAAGLVAAQELAAGPLPEGVEARALGADEFSLIESLLAAEAAVVLDAVSMGAAPGTVRAFTLEEALALPSGATLDLHSFGLAQALRTAGALGMKARVAIVGVQPESLAPGESLSAAVRAAVTALKAAALEALGTGEAPCPSRIA